MLMLLFCNEKKKLNKKINKRPRGKRGLRFRSLCLSFLYVEKKMAPISLFFFTPPLPLPLIASVLHLTTRALDPTSFLTAA